MATDKKINYEMQGGMKNYLGKQKMVKAPKYWKSRPNKPETELAYITQAEKDLIIKANPHGSLAKGPNEGPSGIMSLDYQGDKGTYGGAGQSFGDRERSVSTTRGSPRGPQTVTRTVSPKDTFEQSWSGQPGFLGIGGGYRNLKTPGVTPERGGAYQSRIGGIGRGLLSLLGGIPGRIAGGLSAAKNWATRTPPIVEEEEFQGTMPEGYHYNQKGELTYNAPRPGMLGDYGFKSSVVGTPEYGVEYDVNTEPYRMPPTSEYEGMTPLHPAVRYAQGGRIGYRNGEFVDEDINVQGPGFDVNENIEMAEGKTPFDLRIDELMGKGLSYDDAYDIAAQEFQDLFAEGQQDSFSEEGIASVV